MPEAEEALDTELDTLEAAYCEVADFLNIPVASEEVRERMQLYLEEPNGVEDLKKYFEELKDALLQQALDDRDSARVTLLFEETADAISTIKQLRTEAAE